MFCSILYMSHCYRRCFCQVGWQRECIWHLVERSRSGFHPPAPGHRALGKVYQCASDPFWTIHYQWDFADYIKAARGCPVSFLLQNRPNQSTSFHSWKSSRFRWLLFETISSRCKSRCRLASWLAPCSSVETPYAGLKWGRGERLLEAVSYRGRRQFRGDFCSKRQYRWCNRRRAFSGSPSFCVQCVFRVLL